MVGAEGRAIISAAAQPACGNIAHPSSATLPLTQPAGSGHGDLRGSKRTLRARTLAARDGLAAQRHAEHSRAIAATIVARADFRAAKTLLLTLPLGSEWATAPLFDAAFGQGSTVALPRVDPSTRMLELCVVTDLGHDVAAGYRGIREPLPHCARIDPSKIDWVLVPGVAFDRDGNRLGYGGGFYDRLLPLLAPAVPRVAGAFELQLVERVPAAAHDLAINVIVTELRTLSPAR
jgi:5-formyltetrahydrofolate cyclo-ligase